MKVLPHFKFEQESWRLGFQSLGIDEAGRGAFAGPLAVGGVIFNQDFADKIVEMGINDSKLLSAKKREKLYEEIKAQALFSHVELVPLDIIEEIGIGKATTLGMQRVHQKALEFEKNVFALIDAFPIPQVIHQKAIIHGDRISISIAAASILAKVERDRHMDELAIEFGNYGWDKNKGYGTLSHRKAIQQYGPCLHHRTQFISRFV